MHYIRFLNTFKTLQPKKALWLLFWPISLLAFEPQIDNFDLFRCFPDFLDGLCDLEYGDLIEVSSHKHEADREPADEARVDTNSRVPRHVCHHRVETIAVMTIAKIFCNGKQEINWKLLKHNLSMKKEIVNCVQYTSKLQSRHHLF